MSFMALVSDPTLSAARPCRFDSGSGHHLDQHIPAFFSLANYVLSPKIQLLALDGVWHSNCQGPIQIQSHLERNEKPGDYMATTPSVG